MGFQPPTSVHNIRSGGVGAGLYCLLSLQPQDTVTLLHPVQMQGCSAGLGPLQTSPSAGMGRDERQHRGQEAAKKFKEDKSVEATKETTLDSGNPSTVVISEDSREGPGPFLVLPFWLPV